MNEHHLFMYVLVYNKRSSFIEISFFMITDCIRLWSCCTDMTVHVLRSTTVFHCSASDTLFGVTKKMSNEKPSRSVMLQ
jgi:hypothetical protein